MTDEPWWKRADNALKYYLGPAYEPIGMMGNAFAAISPGADMIDMQQESNALMQSHGGWDTINAGLGLGAATLGMAIPGTAKGISEGVDEAADAVRGGIRAYHGSPADFDAFDSKFIGTGEGAQAYGRGLYFADKEGVAQDYRDKLSRQVSVGGAPLGSHPMDSDLATAQHAIVNRVSDGATPEEAIRQEAAGWREHATMYRDAAAKDPAIAERANQEAASFESVAAQIEAQNPADFVKNPGHMYEVNINASPDDFLDWDKPLSEQSEKVRGGIEKLAEHNDPWIRGPAKTWRDYPSSGTTGGDAYRSIGGGSFDSRASNPKSTEIWQGAGIPGIRYLDQGSRGAGEGSSNYVVFDEKLISILRKYGLLGAAGLGGAAYATGDDRS